MTREEKMNTLKAIIQECEEYQWQRRETLFEIIKDLEQEPTTKNNLAVDCIDRQATLDAIIKRLGIKNETYLLEAERAIYQQILAMPSITPQLSSGLEKNSKKLEKNFGELDDCISRADAIKAMQDKAKELKNEDTINGLCGAVAILYEMPSVTPQEPRWIPVIEQLPEDHKNVLAYLSSDRISICRYNSHKLPFSNNPIGWGYLPGIGFIDFEKEHVIAWMPLPKAYSEVEK